MPLPGLGIMPGSHEGCKSAPPPLCLLAVTRHDSCILPRDLIPHGHHAMRAYPPPALLLLLRAGI